MLWEKVKLVKNREGKSNHSDNYTDSIPEQFKIVLVASSVRPLHVEAPASSSLVWPVRAMRVAAPGSLPRLPSGSVCSGEGTTCPMVLRGSEMKGQRDKGHLCEVQEGSIPQTSQGQVSEKIGSGYNL